MSDDKKKTTKRKKAPRELIDVSAFPHDEKGRAIVPDDFMDANYRSLPDGTINESRSFQAYSGGKMRMLGSNPEKDKEIHIAGGQAVQANLQQRRTFCESLDIALRRKSVDGLSNMDAITASMILKAIDGDVKAAQFIRDTIGEQPTTKTEIQADIMTAADRALIEKLEKRMENRA